MTGSGQATYFDWPETTPGVIPSGPAPTGQQLRLTSENLRVLPTIVDSPELTAGNEPQDGVINGYEGGGDIGIAFSPRNYDRYFENLYWNDFAYQTATVAEKDISSGPVTYVNTTRTLTNAANWDNTPAVGDKILIQGSGNAYLDGIHRVDSATSTTIVLEQDGILSTASVPSIGGGGVEMTIVRGERLTNALTPGIRSMGLEKRVQRTRGTYKGATATQGSPDIDFSVFTKLMVQRIQLQGTGTTPITGTISVRASKETNATEADGGATVMAGTTPFFNTPIFQGIECIKKCRFFFPDISAVAGDAGKIEDTLRICPQSISLEFANNLQETALMCAQPEFEHTPGEPLFQANVTGIYETPYPLVAFEKQYSGVFEIAMVATNGDGYLFRAPRAKMTLARADVTGRSTTIIVNMTVKAYAQVSPVTGDSSRAIEIYRLRTAS